MVTSVTFDSNIWEFIVDEKKRNDSDPVYTKLYDLIKSGVIEPYFFEGLATMETIKKIDRKEYYANYKPKFSMLINGEEILLYNGSEAPILSEYLSELIPQALKLGFRFTRLPRIGAPKLDIAKKYLAPDKKYNMGERHDRSFKCAKYIEEINGGKQVLMNKLGISSGGLAQQTKNNDSITSKKYANFVAEWVDGDALAANYGYGINYFCTCDKGNSAGKSSILYPANLHKLKQEFPINIISPEELVQTLLKK